MSSEKKIRSATLMSQHRAYEHHRSKVRHATSVIDMNPPASRPHVLRNAKRLQLERERQEKIAKDNFILLKKLCTIMDRKIVKPECQSQRSSWQKTTCLRTR